MKNFDSRPYAITDFIEWRDAGLLDLSPDFQRRAVWSPKAKSYLIDTVIRGKPIPKLILMQELKGKRSVRIVVDGQQRLRAILEFFDNVFKLSRAHNKEYAGYTYDRLPEDTQKAFLKYELAVDILFDSDYPELLDIFARINTYTVILQKQEKLNAKYVGYFKNTCYELGLRYVEYFLNAHILSKNKINRMAEAELAGDLLMAMMGGVQSNKALENFYKRYEDEPGNLEECSERFDRVMSVIGELYPAENLANTNWSRPVLFYTLFTTLANLLYGIQGPKQVSKVRFSPRKIGKTRIYLDTLSAKWEEVGADFERAKLPRALKKFVRQSRRATTDTASRIGRVEYLSDELLAALDDE